MPRPPCSSGVEGKSEEKGEERRIRKDEKKEEDKPEGQFSLRKRKKEEKRDGNDQFRPGHFESKCRSSRAVIGGEDPGGGTSSLLLLPLLPPSGVSDVGLLPPSLSASGQLLRRENCGWREEGEEDEEKDEGGRRGDGGMEGKRARRVCFPLGASGGSAPINHPTGGEPASDGLSPPAPPPQPPPHSAPTCMSFPSSFSPSILLLIPLSLAA